MGIRQAKIMEQNARRSVKRKAQAPTPAKPVTAVVVERLATAAEHYKKHEVDLYIETYSGKKFFIEHPEFDIADIAHALAMQCRYTGHCKTFYSVAEHSVLVSKLCTMYDLGDPFEALMHDAAEAYLSDIAAPWKALLPDYKKLEAKIELPLRKHWGLPAVLSDGVKRADWLALFIEARALLPTQARDWIAPEGIKEQAALIDLPVRAFSPALAMRSFINEYARLSQRRV